ncbi:MAG: hypothetical protein EA403_11635 [Spirochaetaceae bacterium]|nr:MAG: hypothetical protein EA403_11635 [Spirochaetaceae bacterium]
MQPSIVAVLVRVGPVVVLIAAGMVVRRGGLVSSSSMEELKKLVVNLALPAVLFRAFFDMDLDWSYLSIFATILIVCVVLWFYGVWSGRTVWRGRPYHPFLTTGFEFGMLGIPLFAAAYGMQYVGYIAIVDLSHELFIWFVFVTLLLRRRDGAASLAQTAGSFIRSPVILGILAGLLLNALGARDAVRATAAGQVALETFSLLGGMLVPAILLIIGYGLRFSGLVLREAIGGIALRLAALIPIAAFVVLVLVRRVFALPLPFERAVVTFLLLPPPYIIPLFMPESAHNERDYVHSVLSLYTALTVVLFVVYVVLNPTI